MQVSTGIPELCALIRDCIARSPQQRIPFAQFMELVLYQPTFGYYTAPSSQPGITGDFVTSSHLSPDFAELLAAQFVEMWQRLGRPQPFHLVEIGPGLGTFAATVLAYLQHHHPNHFAVLHYTLIETSPALIHQQQQRLQAWAATPATLSWKTLDDFSPHSVTGCIFSNELVDALPVHRVTLTAAGLQEQYIVAGETPEQPFAIALGPLSTPALEDYFQGLGIDLHSPGYPMGFTTEVNLAALTWIERIARILDQGYVLTIDYGYAADRYYSPGRSQGTLQCYYRHAHHNDPLINIGQQDITAHVNFTALQQAGAQWGLETLGLLPQALFLMALGLGDRFAALAQIQDTAPAAVHQALQRREALHQLINPLGLGQFNVLVQGKNLTLPEQRKLRGLTIPPLGGSDG